MTKKMFLAATAVLSLWDLLYIAVLSDSLITEYFLDRFFYWGYPQWGFLYSSPSFFLWVNVIYLLLLVIGMGSVYLLRCHPVRAFVPAALIALLSLANLYQPYYNRNSQFKFYGDDSRIPEGKWLLHIGEMQRYADQNLMMKLKGWWGRGDWPGGFAFWGGYRVWMQPEIGTDDKGRRGFVLHGGTQEGTPWGINLGAEMQDFAMKVQDVSGSMELTVDYKEAENRGVSAPADESD